MSFAATAIDFLTGGGITSIATGAIGAYTKLKELKINNEHRQFEMKYEVSMHKLQSAADAVKMEHKLLISEQQTSAADFQAAINAQARISSINLSPKVNGLRALLRPGLTTFLWVCTLVLAFYPATAPIALTFQQGAMAATGFWFGSRAIGNGSNR